MSTRYWIGGTGNWSDGAHWSASSGGATDNTVPTSADDVHFDAGSNTTNAAYTVTVNATANCKDLMFDAKPGDGLGGTITLAGSQVINIYGSTTLLSSMGWTFNNLLYNRATSTGKTITTNNVSHLGGIVFEGAGGSWTLQDNLTVAGAVSVASGAVNFNSKTVSCSSFASTGAVVRSLVTGAATINLASGGTTWNVSSSNFTYTGGTETINITAGYAGIFAGAGFSYGTLNANFAAIANGITGANTFVNLNLIGRANKTDGAYTVGANQTVTGTFTVTGNSAINRVMLQSDTLGTPRTITAGAVSLTNADFMDITFANSASPGTPFTGTSLGDCLGNSGITFTPSATQTATGTASFAWSTHGWTTRVPLPQDDVVINNAFVAGRTITADMPRLGKNISFGCTGSPLLSTPALSAVFGSISYAVGMTLSGTTVDFYGRDNHTIYMNGLSAQSVFRIFGIGGTYSLLGAFTSAYRLQVHAGSFDAAGYSVTCAGLHDGSTSFTRSINFGSGIWTITSNELTQGVTAIVFLPNNITVNAGTSTIKLTDATSATKTFAGGGKTYNNIWLSGAGSGSFNFTGSNTFNDFKVDNLPKDIRFTAATNTTLASFTAPAYNPADTKFVRLPGVSGSYLSTVHAPANTITGRFSAVVYVKLNKWVPTDYQALFQKWHAPAGLSYAFQIMQTTGLPAIYTTADGSTLRGHIASAAPTVADGAGIWLAVTRDKTVGVKFLTAPDVSGSYGTFTQLGATVATWNEDIYAGASQVVFGIHDNTVNYPLAGDAFRGEIYNGIPPMLGGTDSADPVVDMNPNDWNGGNTWVSSTTGETWTRNGSALIYPEVKISSITAAQHTLAKAGGGAVIFNKVNLSYSIASPINTFTAQNATDGGNNTNWLWSATLGDAGATAAGTGAVGTPGVTMAVPLPGEAATGAISVTVPTTVLDLVGVSATTGISITVPTTVLSLIGASATTGYGSLGVDFTLGLTGVLATGYAGMVSLPVNGILIREKSNTVLLRAKSNKVFLRSASV